MTSEIITRDSSERKAPWIGVGVSGEWIDYRDALAAAGMDFYAVPQDAFTHMYNMWGTERDERVPGIQVNVKAGSDQILGVVSSNYGIVQNEDAFSMLEPFTEVGGVITNAGYTEQGLHFMVLRLKEAKILGDQYDVDVMCVNSFNGAFPCALIVVPTRIICQNMYRKLMGNSDHVLRFRHCSQIDERMALVKNAMSGVTNYMAAFELQLQQARRHTLERKDFDKLCAMLFPYPKEGGAREFATRERVDAQRKEFFDDYYLAEDNIDYVGTGMGFINAYYDYLSHRKPTKRMKGSWEDRRLSGLVSGNDVKTGAIKEALV